MAIILIGVRWNLSVISVYISLATMAYPCGNCPLLILVVSNSKSGPEVGVWQGSSQLFQNELATQQASRSHLGSSVRTQEGRNSVHPEDSRWGLSLGAYGHGNSSRKWAHIESG